MGSQKSTPTSAKRDCSTPHVQSELLQRAVEWAIEEKLFADLHLHGNTRWEFKPLIALAVLAAWSEASRLTDAFGKARKLAANTLFGVAIRTYQGMMRALVRWTPDVLPLLWGRFQELMQQTDQEHFRIGKWLPLAVDGSRFTTPRTRSNERAFSATHFGKGTSARSRRRWKNKERRSKKLCAPVKPQIWLTLIWHMGLKLSWCWRTGPSTANERQHLMEMLKTHKFPENTLFCCDAGFVGYELWTAILDSGQSFLIRVGGNVRLLQNLGHPCRGAGIVCLWPNAAARRLDKPIVLRLIELQSARGTIWLVTNVLSEHALSHASLARLYPLRWGVELQFRSVKQTFGRGKLRSRNAQYALVELDWSLIALTLVQLLAAREQVKIAEPPERTSVAAALHAIRYAMENWQEPVHGKEGLNSQLQNATKDTYQRSSSKTSRYQKNYKDPPSAKKPHIQPATEQQQLAYRKLQQAA